jgi:septum formation protein
MLQRPAPRLILASQSAARQAVLLAAGLTFAVCPAGIDEAEVKRDARANGASAEDAALTLATLKAQRVAQCDPEALVIGADQILVSGSDWFNKPIDVQAAGEQLRALRGRSHVLATAAVCQHGERRVWDHVATPRLTMRRFSDGFLDAYLAAEGAGATTTVGAYRLEGRGVHLFGRVEGEHAAILGLPLLALLEFLRLYGVLAS